MQHVAHPVLPAAAAPSDMNAARAAGVRAMHGEVLAGNHKMLQLMARLGFTARFDEKDPRIVRVETRLS